MNLHSYFSYGTEVPEYSDLLICLLQIQTEDIICAYCIGVVQHTAILIQASGTAFMQMD